MEDARLSKKVGGGNKRRRANTAKKTSGNSVRVSVDLPFLKEDVFRELMNAEHPLGISEKKTSFQMIWKGKDPEHVMSVGYTRKTVLEMGVFTSTTMAELVEVEENSKMKWKIVSSSGGLVSMTSNKRVPECCIALRKSARGSTVEITYEYEQLTALCPLYFIGPWIARGLQFILQRKVEKMLSIQMESRGYTSRLEVSATRLQAACASFMVRRVERSIIARERILGGYRSTKADKNNNEPTLKDIVERQWREKKRMNPGGRVSMVSSDRSSMMSRKDVARKTNIVIRGREEVVLRKRKTDDFRKLASQEDLERMARINAIVILEPGTISNCMLRV
ncbi:hypothetical protein AB1Y20_020599 [Prymnesium parvum]|uniref:Coenzyme Q-binding protein COQ10 START domain-containing protein n=1 Tax=Prymnesium parvum TaxID=97485 RepID=A0AB34JVQ5_PRYPA